MRMTAGQLMFWHRLAFAVMSDREDAIAEFVASLRARKSIPHRIEA